MILSRVRTLSVAALVAVPLALSGCATTPASDGAANDASTWDCKGVTVVVNYGILDGTDTAACVVLEGDSANGLDVVHQAGFTTEGSGSYGDAIVCRVNDLPSVIKPVEVKDQPAFVETCIDMPPVYAFWTVWQKASPVAEWEWAQTGLNEVTVSAGESIGLVYTTTDNTATVPVIK